MGVKFSNTTSTVLKFLQVHLCKLLLQTLDGGPRKMFLLNTVTNGEFKNLNFLENGSS